MGYIVSYWKDLEIKGASCSTKIPMFLTARGVAGGDIAIGVKLHFSSASLPTCCVTSDKTLTSLSFSLLLNHRAERPQERVVPHKPWGLFYFQGFQGAMEHSDPSTRVWETGAGSPFPCQSLQF